MRARLFLISIQIRWSQFAWSHILCWGIPCRRRQVLIVTNCKRHPLLKYPSTLTRPLAGPGRGWGAFFSPPWGAKRQKVRLSDRTAGALVHYSLPRACTETSTHVMPKRDSGSWSAVTGMFCVGSHDWFLASRHRTVSAAANPPFEEASPTPSWEFSMWSWAALLPLSGWKVAVCWPSLAPPR